MAVAAAVTILAAPGPDGGGDGKNTLAAVLFGESRRHMGDTLLVAALHDVQMTGVLLQRLADTEHVAVTKDGGYALHEGHFVTVYADVLLIEEPGPAPGPWSYVRFA
ncbi:Uncharacterised protein [Enterobacter asburiae]|uniref:Uncharacterized protein n=1 Tax=Enterobacter asburiae TaxID=61645 RepID=A0A376FIC0_ENTAS|nr:Uncharacterised protein [Enterobacter asburiae]